MKGSNRKRPNGEGDRDTRNINIDILKLIASFGVVTLHTIGQRNGGGCICPGDNQENLQLW